MGILIRKRNTNLEYQTFKKNHKVWIQKSVVSKNYRNIPPIDMCIDKSLVLKKDTINNCVQGNLASNTWN